jgi:hypothetical protein
MPPHLRGKLHVRGTFPRAVSRWVERAFGADARAEVLRLLPFDHAEAFRGDVFNALVWYDLDPVDLFIEAATATLIGGEIGAWRGLARDNFDRDLGPILRPSARIVDLDTLLKRAASGWARVFDAGAMRVVAMHSERAFVRMDGFDAASLGMRYAVVGTMEGLLRSAGAAEVSARVLAGETSFAREFEYELSWRD